MKRCAHCDRVCGDYAGGSATVWDQDGKHNLCHPNVPDRPDCYSLVTVHGEALGSRK